MSTTIKKEEVVNNSNQPQQTMKIRKHIEDYDYFITMGRYVDGKLSQQENCVVILKLLDRNLSL